MFHGIINNPVYSVSAGPGGRAVSGVFWGLLVCWDGDGVQIPLGGMDFDLLFVLVAVK